MKIAQLRFLLPAGLAVLNSYSSPAQDWSQWRGSDRNGKVAGFIAPTNWPEKLTQKWKVNIGKGDSTPALIGNKLYTFGRQDTNEVISCLDASSGKVLWESKYPADFVVTGASAGHPGPRSSVLVEDGKVVTLGVGGILSCVDASDGKVLWRKSTAEDYDGVPARFETSMSPIVINGHCIVHVGSRTNSSILACELATGEIKAKKEVAEGPSSSSPVVAQINDRDQMVIVTSKAILGFDTVDASQLWRVPFEANRGNIVTPLIEGNRVFINGEGRGLTAIKVSSEGASAMWTNSALASRFTTPIVRDGKIYGYAGQFFCADSKTGDVIWKSTNAPAGGTSAVVLDAGSTLFALTVKGDLVAYKPSDKEYSELARYSVSDKQTWAHPIISGKNVFVRNEETVSLWQF